MVKDWHKGTLTAEPSPATNAAAPGRSGHRQRGGSGGGGRGSPSLSSGGGGGGRGAGQFMGSRRSRATAGGGGGGGGGGSGAFSDDDDMMDDEGDSFGGGSGGGGSGGIAGGARSGGGGSGWEGAGSGGGSGFAASQHSSTQGGGSGGGGAGGASRHGRAGERFFGEGKEPGGALKGAVVWCARLSLAISPHPSTARRLSQVFEKAYGDALVDEAELFAVARAAAQVFFTGEDEEENADEEGKNNESGPGGGRGGLSLVRSAVDLVLAYADEDDRSSGWLLRLLGVVQQTVVARGQWGGFPLIPRGGGNDDDNDNNIGSAAGEAERDCLARLATSVFKHKLVVAGAKRSRLVRAAQVSAARAIFDAFPDDGLRDPFASLVFRTATDPDSGVRSAAVGATRILFRRFLPEKHGAIFATVLEKLPPVVVVNDRVELEDDDDEDGDGGGAVMMLASEQAYARLSAGRSENERRYFVVCRREFEATSLVTVADMTVSSTRVTRAALYHLLRRSVRPELASEVRRLTERLARGLGFGSGPALLREHLMFFISEWLRDRSSLDGFPFELLLGHSTRAGRARALRACAHVAVPLAIVQLSGEDRQREVQAMAGELGMGATDNGVARLVRLYVADIKAVYLPLLYTLDGGDGGDGGSASGTPGGGDASRDRAVANEADGFLQRVIDGGKVGKTSDNLQTLVLRLLDMGAVEPFGAFGRVTLRSIADTLGQVASQLDAGSGGGGGGGQQRASGQVAAAAGAADTGDLLRRVNFVEVVLHLRGHIARARGIEAQRRVFDMLEFVVTEARAEEDASCLSSTVSVLLWVLEARASELSAAAATTNASFSGTAAAASCGGAAAVAVVKLMDGVFGRCMSTSDGRQLLGRYFGGVVEQLLGVFVELDSAHKRRLRSRSRPPRSDRPPPPPSSYLPPHEDDDDDDEDSVSDEDDFELAPRRQGTGKKKAVCSRRGAQRSGPSGGGGGSGRRSPNPRVGGAGRRTEEGEEEECGRVASLVLGLLKSLVVDSPASMTGHVSRLHPFPDESSSSPGLKAVSRALATRKELEAFNSPASAASSSTAAPTPAAVAAEVWQAAERLVEGTAGEGGALSSSSSSCRTVGSLLANLSHLRAALRRYTGSSGGSGGGSGGGGACQGGAGRRRCTWRPRGSLERSAPWTRTTWSWRRGRPRAAGAGGKAWR
ncbi:unnamed protein product [Ectocarpus fasciculatus]